MLYIKKEEYLVGDSAYSLSETMIVPFKRHRPLTLKQVQFNKNLSAQRVAVEHCIGVLKGRFQSLRNLRIMVNKTSGHKKACEWIECCVVLHNMLLRRDPWNQTFDDVYLEPEDNDGPSNIARFQQGEQKRNELVELYASMSS